MSEKAENALAEAARLKQEELRAIDAQVAEKVMGWWRERDLWCGQLNDKHVVRNAESIDDIYQPEPRWSPSTSISDAFEVVEKLRGASYYISRTPKLPHYVTFSVGSKDYSAEHDSLPLAICLAALKAVEQQEAKR